MGQKPNIKAKYLDNGFWLISAADVKRASIDGKPPRGGYEKRADISKINFIEHDRAGIQQPVKMAPEEFEGWSTRTQVNGKTRWGIQICTRYIPSPPPEPYPPKPEGAKLYQHHYGYEKPTLLEDWQWSTTFNRWGRLVTFADGWHGLSWPKLS